MQLNTLGFTRSGFYYYRDGTLLNQSSGGSYWAHGVPNNYSYLGIFLNFYSTSLNPYKSYNHGYGFILRCLAR